MRKVLISHPHAAAFANGTASSLERSGHLGLYVTGLAAPARSVVGRALELVGRRFPTVRNRIVEGIPAEKVKSLAWVEGWVRMKAGVNAALGRTSSTYDALFTMHDAAVASMRWPAGLEMVYAYEDGALDTFEKAAKADLERYWDLPIPHHRMLERMLIDEARRWPGAVRTAEAGEPEWKRRRKDAELELASRVFVPSAFTRESLQAAGVTKRIDVVPFGFPVDGFNAKELRPAGPFTVIAVGSQNLRKGTPYLLEAWKRAALRDARLLLVGRMGLSPEFTASYRHLYEHLPHVPRKMLPDVYRSADLLVLPTLGDGCPLVVQEAMCCGTAVLTTRCGNGPEFITDDVEGWVVRERDVDALVERLREAASDREKLHRMGQAARRRAKSWTWRHAGDELARALVEPAPG